MSNLNYTLCQNVYNNDEIIEMNKIILSEKYTMGDNVYKFEKLFSDFIGVKYAVMVNSGSSANLLAFSVATNHKNTNRIECGSEILVSSVCWSTSVFPIIQCGLIPIFVDTDINSLNVNIDDLESKITTKTRGIMLVHVLGNCCDMDRLMKIVEKHNLILFEDTCESLGSMYNNKYLGTFGNFGTYSFYYSHHITTIEGGMVICKTEEEYELVKCLRAHGWTRNLKDKEELQNKYLDIDSRFTFVNLGYNFRPTEIQGALGQIQLNKLETKNNNRLYNYNLIKLKILSDVRNKNYITFPEQTKNCKCVWFGIPMYLSSKIILSNYLQYLTQNNIENRPVVTGNMTRQPVIKELYPNINHLDFIGSEYIHTNGFFIGLPCEKMSIDDVNKLVDILLNYTFFTDRYNKKILITGGQGCIGYSLQNIIDNDENNYIFLSSKQCDLRNRDKVLELFDLIRPDYIIHLAARVVGMYHNMRNIVIPFSDNIKINENVLEACNTYNVQRGIFCLSSGIFTDSPSKYPMDENMIYEGEPSYSISSYGYSKRMLAFQCNNYNKQYNREYICIIPSNLYGPNDRFDLDTAHLIPALLHKFYNAIKNNTDIIIYGSGKPVKQFLFSYDLARIIIYLLFNYTSTTPVICCNDETSISDAVNIISDITKFNNNIKYDTTKNDGCYRRTMTNKYFDSLCPNFKYTSLKDGLEITYKWFVNNYNNARLTQNNNY